MEKEKIKDIAENIDFGMRCFVHLETKDAKFIPDQNNIAYADPDVWSADIEEIEENSGDYLEIIRMDSHESYQVMEDYINTVDDKILKGKLIDALERPKPFRNFKYIIDDSEEYRDKWFRFKEEKLMDMVARQLEANGLL